MTARKPSLRVAIAAIWLMLNVSPAGADKVHLVNGDLITGEILELDDDEMVVDADMIDEVRIDVEDIAWLETNRSFVVQFDDGSEATGLVVFSDGKMYVQPADASGDTSASTSPDGMREVRFEEVFAFEPVEAFYRYEGDIDVGINGSSGNTEQASFNVSGELAPSIGRNTLRISGQLNRAVADGERTDSNWRIQGAYEREFNRRWAIVGINRYERDRFQDLSLRITGAAGPRRTIFEKRPSLEVFLGPAVVDESFVSDDDRTFAAALWALEFEWEWDHPDLTLYHDHNIVAGLSDRQTIVLTQTGIKWELLDDVDLKLEYQFDWNNRPVEDAQAIDQRYLIKLSFDLEGDQTDWWQ